MSELDQTVINAPNPVRTSSPLLSNNIGQNMPALSMRNDAARRYSTGFNVQGQYVDQHGYGYGQVTVAPQYGQPMPISSNVQLVPNNPHLAYQQQGMVYAYYSHPGNDVQAADAAAVRRVSSAPSVQGQYVDQLGHGHGYGQAQVNVGAQYGQPMGQASLGATTPSTNVPQHDAHLACAQRGMVYAYPNYGSYPNTDEQADEMRRYSTTGVQGQYWDQFGHGYGQVNVGVPYGQAIIQGSFCESAPPNLQQVPHNAHIAYQQGGMVYAYHNYYGQPSYDDRVNEATVRIGAVKINGDSRHGAGTPFRGTPTGYSNLKTRLCRSFSSTGSCPHGEKCRFAHGEKELQSAVPPTSQNEKYQMKNTKFEPNQQRRTNVFRGNSPSGYSNYKTRMCAPYSTKGSCQHGENCRFAHTEMELRSATPVTSNGRYKTKLCKHFESNGSGKCNYGSQCEFIHPSDGEYRKSLTPKKEQKNCIQHLCRKGSVDGPSLNK